jgi:hypothetical protein
MSSTFAKADVPKLTAPASQQHACKICRAAYEVCERCLTAKRSGVPAARIRRPQKRAAGKVVAELAVPQP